MSKNIYPKKQIKGVLLSLNCCLSSPRKKMISIPILHQCPIVKGKLHFNI